MSFMQTYRKALDPAGRRPIPGIADCLCGVILSRAMTLEPELLLIDEILDGVQPGVIQRITAGSS